MRHKMRTLKTILLFIPYTVYILFCKIFRKKKNDSWYNDAHEGASAGWNGFLENANLSESGGQLDRAICNSMTKKQN